MPTTGEKHAGVILNTSAGFHSSNQTVERIRKIFLNDGWNCSIELVEAGADIGAIASRHIQHGATRIVAGGGDGTLRAAASAVAGTGVAMAILPVGTLNHFARDLDIPFDVEEAATVAASTGVEVAVDFGEVNGHGFINNCVLGLYPSYRNQRDLHEKAGWSSWTSVLAGIAAVVSRYPKLVLRFRIDGVDMTRRTAWVMLANNAHAMEGYKPWQRDTLTSGDIWVYILRDRGRFELLRVFAKLLSGGSLAVDEFEVVSASHVIVESQRRWIAISVDGEVMWLRAPLHFTSHSRELRVVVPPQSKRIPEALCELPGGLRSAP